MYWSTRTSGVSNPTRRPIGRRRRRRYDHRYTTRPPRTWAPHAHPSAAARALRSAWCSTLPPPCACFEEHHRRRRYGTACEREPGLWRSELILALIAKPTSSGPCASVTAFRPHRGRRWHFFQEHSRGRRRPAPTCSWPVLPYLSPKIPLPRLRCCRSWATRPHRRHKPL